ncbi:hypothetical protein [Legionella sp. WA2022007384]
MERINERIALHLMYNEMAEKDSWYEQQTLYTTKFLPAFYKYKDRFIQSAEQIMQEDNPNNKRQFEIGTKQYYQALKLLRNCQLVINESLFMYNRVNGEHFEQKIEFLQTQYKLLEEEVNIFKTKVNEVSFHFEDKKMKYFKDQEISLPTIATKYEKAYEDSYGRFWGWIKSLFQKSDRVQELKFLKTISEHSDCDKLIQVQAATLVHNKIRASELFGRGSQLALILESFLKGKDPEVGEHGNLVQFLQDHEEIKKLMPKSLKEYFEENQQEYNQGIINAVRF